jgi:BirA family transcriptional regulator, biotin operon repressor / biotin---[acetyl-CoA-carboxylase] ligase
VALAEHQSAGRGRLGRRWQAPAGANLLLSVLLRPNLPAGDRHLASAVVALAAADAVQAELGVTLSIKWPNDLLARDGRKVAGVLAEADVASGPATAPIVVGIGLNVNWPVVDNDLPEELVGRATSLCQQLGRPVDRLELADAVLEALEPRVEALDSPLGRSEQAADLRRLCSTIGTEVSVELAGEHLVGKATDVTAEGHLQVEVAGAIRTVVAGDVVHLRSRS